MRNVRNLCNDTVKLQKKMITKVIKDSGKVYNSDDDLEKVYDLDILPVQKCFADEEDSEEGVEVQKSLVDPTTSNMNATFKDLMTMLMLNQTGGDSVMDSFLDLIEGVRCFQERWGIRKFVDQYQLANQKKTRDK